ncbi:MAG: hypothetical protein JO337_04365 [Acidimicrobiales bacterium]|nr:hypothetical protein [Acidimicrobiales bacterium]
MKIFDIDPAEHRDAYRRQQWVSISQGCTSEFLDYLQAQYGRRREDEKLFDVGNTAAKDQYRFEPPPDTDMCGELFGLVEGICQTKRSTMVLSERHVNRYLDHVNPNPPAHKDRFATQIAVGIAIEVPEESRLVMYPEDHRDVNPYGMSAEYRASLPPDELPEVVLADSPSIEIADRPGDVHIFPGSSMWHLRRAAAGTVVLYLKCNDFNCDPLGEDPSSAGVRASTEAVLGAADPDLTSAVPALSRRLQWVARLAGRDGQERPFAKLWQEEPFAVTEEELAIVRALEHGSGRLASAGNAAGDQASIVGLARRGVLDLLPAPVI